MSVASIVRDWLLLVGDQYGIREAHQDRRRGDQGKHPRPHFIFRFSDSTGQQGTAQNLTTASGTHGAIVEHYKQFTRTLEIECWTPMRRDVGSEIDGMRVLEAVQISIEHPAVQEVLQSEAANRITVSDALLPMTNITEQDESFITRGYVLTMTVRINTHFGLLRTDHRVDDYTLTGDLITDEGDTIEVSVADETT